MSQFDETLKGECCYSINDANKDLKNCDRLKNDKKKNKNVCCAVTCQKILNDVGAVPIGEAVNTAVKADDELQTVKSTGNIKDHLAVLDGKLKEGKPILIGLHYAKTDAAYNANPATRHFVIIVGTGYNGAKKYYQFYDVGRGVNSKNEATNENNRLFVENDGLIRGTYNANIYTITEIRK